MNKKFHRIHRVSNDEWCNEISIRNQVSEEQFNQIVAEKNAKKQQEKEERWATRGTLGELTEKYISEGESEEDAYNTAKQELGL